MGIPISTARAHFDFIRSQSDPFAYLSSLPDTTATHYPFFEEEWLDFKGNPRDDKDARRIWSKALSGYANITDGLIIWGIDARQLPPRDIDAASGLRLIPDPAAFESKLRDWIRDATNPPTMCVEYESYTDSTGHGFVVCLIPESNHKPHRAEFADKHYYYRAGDDFLVAEPGLLRALFYPKQSPILSAAAILSFNEASADIKGNIYLAITIKLFILNNGNHSANNVCIVVDHNQSDHPEIGAGVTWGFIGLRPDQPFVRGQQSLHAIAFQLERPLPPGLNSMAGILSWRKEEIELEDDGPSCIAATLTEKKLCIELGIYCDSMSPIKCNVVFEGDDFRFSEELNGKQFNQIAQ